MLAEGVKLAVGSHRVKIIRFLSEGGFSKIYEVHMDPPHGDSKIGCLKQVLCPDKTGLNTLRREVDVMKTLRESRSVVKYYDSNAERLPDGTYQVLVLMELCPNNSLLHYMNDRIRLKLTEPEILKIMLDISIGVFEMHKIKLVHRDIKIENVLIDAKHNFKLCDFGSVSPPVRPPQNQEEFQFLANDILYNTTPQYRSPEMIDLNRGYPIDERCDIWALGCFLYKLCYYITPFEANGEIAIVHASFQFPPAPAYSGDLKNLIIIMLQENPRFRPNIVQILMLLAKLLNVDFEKLHIDDIYHLGPYDFQALHEMQREKQKQFLKQQQFYFEQQKKQEEARAKSDAMSQHIRSSDDLGLVSAQATPAVSATSNPQSLHPNSMTSKSRELKSPFVSRASSLNRQPSKHPLRISPESEAELSSLLDDDIAGDITDLADAEVRYPSLDALIKAASTEELNSPSIIPKTRISFDETENRGASEPLDSQLTKKSSSSGAELEDVLAWKQPTRKSIDKDAEKLVDEIFLTKSRETALDEAKRDDINTSKVSELEVLPPQKAAKVVSSELPSPEILVGQAASLKKQPNIELTKRGSGFLDALSQAKYKSPEFLTTDYSHGDGVRVSHLKSPSFVPNGAADTSNPWGKAMDKTPKSEVISRSSAEIPRLDINEEMQNLSLGESTINDSFVNDSFGENLIDLDTEASQPVEQATSSEIAAAIKPKRSFDANDLVLVDLEFDTPRHATPESKPHYKKKNSTAQAQRLSFEEQVIDFASDDENDKSEMSRLSIRDSLKKSRKHSDHKRTDSAHGESRKRLSFFGGTSDKI